MATEDQIRDFERKWWGLLLCRMWEQWQNESIDGAWNRSGDAATRATNPSSMRQKREPTYN